MKWSIDNAPPSRHLEWARKKALLSWVRDC